jgi:two-component system, chemotaxis family, CheB/CheR fusion protein
MLYPHNYHLQITDHDISRTPDHQERPKPSIDHLLKSAAEIYGEALIAVILTGMGSDGASGAREVKERGGTVIIQDPQTAAYPSMPLSLQPSVVDITAPLEKIAQILYDLLMGELVPEHYPGETDAGDTEAELQQLLTQVHDISGVDFSSYKRGTIQRRIQRRMVAIGTPSLAEYQRYVDIHAEEYQRLISSFLIKVTEFMRDQELFSMLQREILPVLVERAEINRTGELRIWSAGCATGEEAYSLAILVSEVLNDRLERFNVKIFSTDLDPEAVAFARRGIYPASALATMPNHLIKRYFTERNGNYEVSHMIRRLIVFGEHDLAQRAPFPRIDLVVCRNVLIYFTRELQQRTLRLFAFSLRNDGYLVLGKAETVSPSGEHFVTDYPQLKIYRRRGERLLIPPPLDADTPHTAAQRTVRRQRQGVVSELSRIQRQLQRSHSTNETLLLNLPVGVVVVNQQYDIQEINSAARRLLGIYSPAIGQDFVHLAQNLPARELLQAINQAVEENRNVSLDEVAVEDMNSGQRTYLQLTCYPYQITEQEKVLRYGLILVTDVTAVIEDRRQLEAARDEQARLAAELERTVAELRRANADLEQSNARLQQANADLETARQQALERGEQNAQNVERLMQTNRDLVKANEELSNTNQELRFINDEFLMTNEEAQAATEELETLNEETQATNEELETLNEELQGTIEELTTTNNDLMVRNECLLAQIGDLEAAQQAGIQEQTLLRELFARLPDALLLVNAAGEPWFSNAAYDDLMRQDGHVTDEQGQTIPPEVMPQARAARGESFSMPLFIRTLDGNQHYTAHGYPLPNQETGAGGIVIIRREA